MILKTVKETSLWRPNIFKFKEGIRYMRANKNSQPSEMYITRPIQSRERLRRTEEEVGGGVSSAFGRAKKILEDSFHENSLGSSTERC
jgi:hypothetical protein